MKKSEIHTGETYSNGKEGRFYSERKVLSEGDFLLYPEQINSDCLRYEVIAGLHKGATGNITRTKFAAWAKFRVDMKN